MTKTKKQLIALVAVLFVAVALIGTYFMISGQQQRKAEKLAAEEARRKENGALYTLGDETVAALKALDTEVIFKFNEPRTTSDDAMNVAMKFAEEYAYYSDKVSLQFNSVEEEQKTFSVYVNGNTSTFVLDKLFLTKADGTKYAFDGEKAFNAAIFSTEVPSVLRALNGFDTDGDTVNAQGQPFMYAQSSREDVLSLQVTNEYGTYLAYSLDDSFYFKDAEKLTMDKEMFSQLIVDSTYTLAQYKLKDPGALSDYRLGSDEEALAVVEVFTKDGAYHKILIGKKLADGTGYYAKYYTKDFVYVIDTTVETAILQPLENYLSATLVVPVANASIESATIYTEVSDIHVKYLEDGIDVAIDLLTEEESSKLAVNTIWKLTSPQEFIPKGRDFANPNLSNVSDMLLELVVLSSEEIVHVGLEEDTLSKYGLDTPSYELSYVYQDYRSTVYFSAYDSALDGYYAYSLITSLTDESLSYYTGAVVFISASDFEYLKWEPLKYRDSSLYMSYIHALDNVKFYLDGKEYDFKLGKTDGSLTEVKLDGKTVDLTSFKYLYQAILLCKLEGEYESSDQLPSETFRFIIQEGELTTDVVFYRVSSRKAYYTINGEGKYYVSIDDVNNVKDKLLTIASGDQITRDS